MQNPLPERRVQFQAGKLQIFHGKGLKRSPKPRAPSNQWKLLLHGFSGFFISLFLGDRHRCSIRATLGGFPENLQIWRAKLPSPPHHHPASLAVAPIATRRQALRFDPENIQILRDLSLLQIHRPGARATRREEREAPRRLGFSFCSRPWPPHTSLEGDSVPIFGSLLQWAPRAGRDGLRRDPEEVAAGRNREGKRRGLTPWWTPWSTLLEAIGRVDKMTQVALRVGPCCAQRNEDLASVPFLVERPDRFIDT